MIRKTAIPTPRQLEFQDWEMGLFVHFGIRTFYEGHRDFDGRPMDPRQFNPVGLDCNPWIQTAAEAGMKYAILTAKQHDGFANWPSTYTKCSVASSPWREGQGDVVKEFVEACRRYGLKPGLYYSPADVDCPLYADPKAYDDYFINQISELLTGYGPIDLLWFDGCGSEGHEYDWERIVGEIRRMQPDILIFNMGDPDYRWVGNECGLAPYPCWNTVDAVAFSIYKDQEELQEPRWLPAECDCRMRFSNWFYSDHDAHTVKSLKELMGLYYYSVGRGANLLINIGPNREGLLPEPDAQRLKQFGAEIRRRFERPLVSFSQGQLTPQGWECTAEEPVLIDHMIIQEDLRQGEHVEGFTISILPTHGSQEIVIYEGKNIGHKAICQFPPVRARKVKLNITAGSEDFTLRSVALYCVED